MLIGQRHLLAQLEQLLLWIGSSSAAVHGSA
jgi:hypothetical protein